MLNPQYDLTSLEDPAVTEKCLRCAAHHCDACFPYPQIAMHPVVKGLWFSSDDEYGYSGAAEEWIEKDDDVLSDC